MVFICLFKVFGQKIFRSKKLYTVLFVSLNKIAWREWYSRFLWCGWSTNIHTYVWVSFPLPYYEATRKESNLWRILLYLLTNVLNFVIYHLLFGSIAKSDVEKSYNFYHKNRNLNFEFVFSKPIIQPWILRFDGGQEEKTDSSSEISIHKHSGTNFHCVLH